MVLENRGIRKLFSIYEAGNHLLVCADYIEPVLHSHSAAHIMISLDNEIEVILEKRKIHCRGIFQRNHNMCCPVTMQYWLYIVCTN